MEIRKVHDRKCAVFLRRLEKVLDLYPHDLGIWVRRARSGKPTFAVCLDADGRTFPRPWFSDEPLWRLREEVLPQAIRGARIVRRARDRGIFLNWSPGKLLELGYKCSPPSPPVPLRERLKNLRPILEVLKGC